jgi:hypothetical protein
MYTAQINTSTRNLVRNAFAAIAIGFAVIAFVAVGTAHADPKKGSGTAKGCLIENDGHLETVAVGSKIGLFTCGSDGEWHFGWLINAISAPPKKVKPIIAGAVSHSALRAVRVAR